MHDVGPRATEHAPQSGQAGEVLDGFRRPSQPGADWKHVGARIEVLDERIVDRLRRLSVHELRRPERDLVAARREGRRELVVVRTRIARRIDQRNVQGSGV